MYDPDKTTTPPSYLVTLAAAEDTVIDEADGNRTLLRVQVQGAFDARVRVMTGREETADAGTHGGTVGEIVAADARVGKFAGGVFQTEQRGRVVGRGVGGQCVVHVTKIRR